MSGYKHWRNSQETQRVSFVTTTTIDFARLFARDSIKDHVVQILADDCIATESILFGFVVMVHHMHAIIGTSREWNISQVIKRFKSNTAREIRPHLLPDELEQMSMQEELNERAFWMRSFRGNVMISERVFRQKMAYIHQNPVRAGLVTAPQDYRWSSGRYYYESSRYMEHGLDLECLIRDFRPS